MSREKHKREEKETFENILKRLEEIVEKMENPGLSLDESMTLYQEGIEKAKKLNIMLSDARNKVMKLVVGKNGIPSVEPFDSEDSE